MRKLLINIGLVLVLSLLLFPSSVSASPSTDISLAQKSAQTWLTGTLSVNHEISQWNNASVNYRQTYDNLTGAVDAYMFEIDGKTGTAGYILVGNSSYNYDVLEAGAASPPICSFCRCCYSIHKNAGNNNWKCGPRFLDKFSLYWG